MESLLPSELARLVLGYLEEQKCDEAAQYFLENSPHLSECLAVAKQGRKFSTRVLGNSLNDILDEYCAVHSLVSERLQKLPENSAEQLRQCGSLIEQLRFLIDATRSGQTVLVSITVPPQSGSPPGSNVSSIVSNRQRPWLQSTSERSRRTSIRWHGQDSRQRTKDKEDRTTDTTDTTVPPVEATPLESLPGLGLDSRSTQTAQHLVDTVQSIEESADAQAVSSSGHTQDVSVPHDNAVQENTVDCVGSGEEPSHLCDSDHDHLQPIDKNNQMPRNISSSCRNSSVDKGDASLVVSELQSAGPSELSCPSTSTPRRKSCSTKKKGSGSAVKNLSPNKSRRLHHEDGESSESVALSVHRALLDNKELHEKIAENINRVIRIPGEAGLTASEQTQPAEPSTECDSMMNELNHAIKTIVDQTQQDPLFERFLEEIIGPVDEEMTPSPADLESETEEASGTTEEHGSSPVTKSNSPKSRPQGEEQDTIETPCSEVPLKQRLRSARQRHSDTGQVQVSPIASNKETKKVIASLEDQNAAAIQCIIDANFLSCDASEGVRSPQRTPKDIPAPSQSTNNPSLQPVLTESEPHSTELTNQSDSKQDKIYFSDCANTLTSEHHHETLVVTHAEVHENHSSNKQNSSDNVIKQITTCDKSVGLDSCMSNANINKDMILIDNSLSFSGNNTLLGGDLGDSFLLNSPLKKQLGSSLFLSPPACGSGQIMMVTMTQSSDLEQPAVSQPITEEDLMAMPTVIVCADRPDHTVYPNTTMGPHLIHHEKIGSRYKPIAPKALPLQIVTSNPSKPRSPINLERSDGRYMHIAPRTVTPSTSIPVQIVTGSEMQSILSNVSRHNRLEMMSVPGCSTSGTHKKRVKKALSPKPSTSGLSKFISKKTSPKGRGRKEVKTEITSNVRTRSQDKTSNQQTSSITSLCSLPTRQESDLITMYSCSGEGKSMAATVFYPKVDMSLPNIATEDSPAKVPQTTSVSQEDVVPLKGRDTLLGALDLRQSENSVSLGTEVDFEQGSEKPPSPTIVETSTNIIAPILTVNLSKLNVLASVKKQEHVIKQIDSQVVGTLFSKDSDTPETVTMGHSIVNPKRLSLSTPRRHRNHIRALDFGTPIKSGTEVSALKRSHTSPKGIIGKRLSPRASGSMAKSVRRAACYKSPLSRLSQLKNVRSSLFKSPDPPTSPDSGPVPCPIATRSPAPQLVGGWDKVTGAGLIFGDVSPQSRTYENIEVEAGPSRTISKTMFSLPESSDRVLETEDSVAASESNVCAPEISPSTEKNKVVSSNFSPKGTFLKPRIKSSTWDADLRAVLARDYMNDSLDEPTEPSLTKEQRQTPIKQPKRYLKTRSSNKKKDTTKTISKCSKSKKTKVCKVTEEEARRVEEQLLNNTLGNSLSEEDPQVCTQDKSIEGDPGLANTQKDDVQDAPNDTTNDTTNEDQRNECDASIISKTGNLSCQNVDGGSEPVPSLGPDICDKETQSDENEISQQREAEDMVVKKMDDKTVNSTSIKKPSNSDNQDVTLKSPLNIESTCEKVVSSTNKSSSLSCEDNAITEEVRSSQEMSLYSSYESSIVSADTGSGIDKVSDQTSSGSSKVVLSPTKLKASKRTFVQNQLKPKPCNLMATDDIEENLETFVISEDHNAVTVVNKSKERESVQDNTSHPPILNVSGNGPSTRVSPAEKPHPKSCNSGSLFALETPRKVDNSDLLSLIPLTPRVLSPRLQEDTPLTKSLSKFLQGQQPCIDLAMIQTPSFPPTPNIAVTPQSNSSQHSMDSPTTYCSRPTDYSSCSSYYNPSISIPLEQVLIEECNRIEETCKNEIHTENTDENNAKKQNVKETRKGDDENVILKLGNEETLEISSSVKKSVALQSMTPSSTTSTETVEDQISSTMQQSKEASDLQEETIENIPSMPQESMENLPVIHQESDNIPRVEIDQSVKNADETDVDKSFDSHKHNEQIQDNSISETVEKSEPSGCATLILHSSKLQKHKDKKRKTHNKQSTSLSPSQQESLTKSKLVKQIMDQSSEELIQNCLQNAHKMLFENCSSPEGATEESKSNNSDSEDASPTGKSRYSLRSREKTVDNKLAEKMAVSPGKLKGVNVTNINNVSTIPENDTEKDNLLCTEMDLDAQVIAKTLKSISGKDANCMKTICQTQKDPSLNSKLEEIKRRTVAKLTEQDPIKKKKICVSLPLSNARGTDKLPSTNSMQVTPNKKDVTHVQKEHDQKFGNETGNKQLDTLCYISSKAISSRGLPHISKGDFLKGTNISPGKASVEAIAARLLKERNLENSQTKERLQLWEESSMDDCLALHLSSDDESMLKENDLPSIEAKLASLHGEDPNSFKTFDSRTLSKDSTVKPTQGRVVDTNLDKVSDSAVVDAGSDKRDNAEVESFEKLRVHNVAVLEREEDCIEDKKSKVAVENKRLSIMEAANENCSSDTEIEHTSSKSGVLETLLGNKDSTSVTNYYSKEKFDQLNSKSHNTKTKRKSPHKKKSPNKSTQKIKSPHNVKSPCNKKPKQEMKSCKIKSPLKNLACKLRLPQKKSPFKLTSPQKRKSSYKAKSPQKKKLPQKNKTPQKITIANMETTSSEQKTDYAEMTTEKNDSFQPPSEIRDEFGTLEEIRHDNNQSNDSDSNPNDLDINENIDLSEEELGDETPKSTKTLLGNNELYEDVKYTGPGPKHPQFTPDNISETTLTYQVEEENGEKDLVLSVSHFQELLCFQPGESKSKNSPTVRRKVSPTRNVKHTTFSNKNIDLKKYNTHQSHNIYHDKHSSSSGSHDYRFSFPSQRHKSSSRFRESTERHSGKTLSPLAHLYREIVRENRDKSQVRYKSNSRISSQYNRPVREERRDMKRLREEHRSHSMRYKQNTTKHLLIERHSGSYDVQSKRLSVGETSEARWSQAQDASQRDLDATELLSLKERKHADEGSKRVGQKKQKQTDKEHELSNDMTPYELVGSGQEDNSCETSSASSSHPKHAAKEPESKDHALTHVQAKSVTAAKDEGNDPGCTLASTPLTPSTSDESRSLPPKKRKASTDESPTQPEKRTRTDNPQTLLKSLDLDRFLSYLHGNKSS